MPQIVYMRYLSSPAMLTTSSSHGGGNTIYSSTMAAPELHILDNECSSDMIHNHKSFGVAYQLVPPHLHRKNALERSIRTLKNQLTAGLCTCNTKFPSSYWDYLIPQATLTLNLLRSARRKPFLSAHVVVFGQLNFNATPLASPGTKFIIYDKTRKIFGARDRDG